MDLKQKNELANSLVQKDIKPSPLELNPLFDNKENYRNFLETGQNDFDKNNNNYVKIKEEQKKNDVEDIYMRKKRLAEVRDIIIKKKKEERETLMKNYQKVIFSQYFN